MHEMTAKWQIVRRLDFDDWERARKGGKDIVFESSCSTRLLPLDFWVTVLSVRACMRRCVQTCGCVCLCACVRACVRTRARARARGGGGGCGGGCV